MVNKLDHEPFDLKVSTVLITTFHEVSETRYRPSRKLTKIHKSPPYRNNRAYEAVIAEKPLD